MLTEDVEKWKLELVRKFFGVTHQGSEIAMGEEGLGHTGGEKEGLIGNEDDSLMRNKDVKIIDIEDSSSEDDDELHVQNIGVSDAEIFEARKVANSIMDLIMEDVLNAQDFAAKVAGEIIDLVIDSVMDAEAAGGTIDAGHVVFSCIDVRLKTGFPAPSPLVVKKKDKRKAEFEMLIVKFLESKDQHYNFSSELNSYERRLVHELGEKNKLEHESVGEGEDRHIMLKKKEKPRVVGSSTVIEERFKNIVAAPGDPVEIPDIEEKYLVDGSDEEFCQELAQKLQEEKVDMVQGLVEMLGRELVLEFFKKTQEVEASGGLLIMNGARRRTSGGVFLQLLRKTEDRKVRDDVDNFFVGRQREDERKKSAKIAAAKEKNKKRLASEMKEMLKAEKD